MIGWLSQLMTTHVPVLVVGAGISGLALTYYLRKAGIDAQIVEASPRPGGVIRSERRDGFLLELGPQSFSGTSQLLELVRGLGIENELLEAPPRAPRFLLLNGQLKPAPLSPPAFFASSLFSARTKWNILRDLFGRSTPPDGDESVAAFMRRKFSAELLDKLVGPFVSGIYAGDPEKLSLRAAFPQLHEAERSAGSVIRGMMRAAKSKPGAKQRATLQTFREGNETLIKAFAKNLGSALRTEVSVSEIRRANPSSPAKYQVSLTSKGSTEQVIADHLVLATPTHVTATLVRCIQPELASALCAIEYAPVAVVSLGYPKSAIAHSLDGFGFLIPRSSGLRTLGTVWNSSLFPGRATDAHALFTSFLGGATDPQAVTLSPDELVSQVHKEIAPLLKISQSPSFSSVMLYQRALPQYNLGHSERLASLQEFKAELPGLWFTGSYLRGPAIGACIEQALAVADEIRVGLSATLSG
jgi:protoporphyrinogen/coproporphyrinogen III oxidase